MRAHWSLPWQAEDGSLHEAETRGIGLQDMFDRY